jgi:hypothetical protein
MGLSVLQIAIIATFLIIIYQDFRHRAISWWLIPLMLILGFLQSSIYHNWQMSLHFFIQNLIFLIVQVFILFIYFFIREKRFVNIIDTWLGLGDVLFFLGLATLFSLINFVAFFIGSIIATLLIFIIISQFSTTLKTIPLAGGMAACYILMLAFLNFNPLILYQDEYLLSWLLTFMNN